MSTSTRMVRVTALGALVVICFAGAARAETWVVSGKGTEGVPPPHVSTFRRLLADELSTRGKNAQPVEPTCPAWSCLQEAARAAGANVAVESELLPLGTKLLVRAQARDVESGAVRGTSRLTSTSVEELETVAIRLAEALVSGKRVEETAEVGTAVKAEDDMGRLRGGRNGVALIGLGIAPLDGDYADGRAGVGLDLAYWFETRNFALEPRIGFHVDGDGGDARFFELPLEVSAYWVPLAGDVSPFIGIGGGLRHVWERRVVDVTVGSTFVTTSQARVEESAWGFGATVRGGVVLFRTYRLRLLLTAEYSAAFLELNERKNPQALRFGAGLLF